MTEDLIRRAWARFPPKSKDFFFALCGSLFTFTRAILDDAWNQTFLKPSSTACHGHNGTPSQGTTGHLSSSTRGNVFIRSVFRQVCKSMEKAVMISRATFYSTSEGFSAIFPLWSVTRNRKQSFFSLANCQRSSTPLSWNCLQNHAL